MADNKKPVTLSKELHSQLKRKAVVNDIKLYLLVEELLQRMLTEHKEEVEEIIKELKILKSS